MNISVVVPNWNGADFLQRSIDSLLNQSVKCSVIVVENGSTDESDEILAQYGNKITVLKQQKNLGFAGGVNVGIDYALRNESDYIALFNNDAIADNKWLNELLKVANKSNKAGIVTSKFRKVGTDILDSTGDFYSIYGLPFPRGRGQVDKGQLDALTDVFGGSGGASLYSSTMLKEIGLFDEDYFAYFEDVDISFRAQLAGWKAYFAPNAIADHHIGGTSKKLGNFTVYQTAKNFWFVYTKNMPGYLFFKYLPLASYWYIRMLFARVVKGGVKSFLHGWLISVWLLPKKLIERHRIQSNRKVSIKYINSILYHHRPPKI